MFKRVFKKTLPLLLAICVVAQTLCGIIMNVGATSASVVTMTYYAGGGWNNFTSGGVAEASDITGIKIQTSSSSYYLKYRTLNDYASGYFDYVNSNINDFAGTTKVDATTGNKRVLKQLQIEVYDSSNNKVSTGIVVMYRAKVNGTWLSWVSNAGADWMQSCQSKYNLGGSLDIHGSYAGTDNSLIEALEIHVYEEDDIVTSGGTFYGSESDAGFTYSSNTTSAWASHIPVNSVEFGLDCIKIQTIGKGYYLKYQTMNDGAGSFYSDVSSNDTANFAGAEGKPIQLLRIKAYANDGAKLTSGIVVMYRTKVNNAWLPWVSNADPEYMIAVQSKFNLGGTLDTHSSYAGKIGSDIEGLQIRVFEGEIPATNVTGLSGGEYSPSISFLENDLTNWQSFSNGSSGMQDQIAGLKIQTSSNKDYYLSYKVAPVGGSLLPAVKSNEAEWAGKEKVVTPIEKVAIQVYNSAGVKQIKNIVVMYRAYSDGKWWPWVSNADPEWMQSVLMKYHLDGALDTKSGDAGASGKAIQNLEIRIFEENAVETVTSPTGNYKIINTPYIYQKDKYPTACESVSTVMALQYSGMNVSPETFINHYLDKTSNISNFDPNEYFGGNPYSSGFGCYAPVIKKACDTLLAGKTQYATELHGVSLQSLCSTYIDNNIPVVLWATTDMKAPYLGADIGIGGRWIAPEHCLLLVGYDQYNYIFKDPQVLPNGTNTNTYYSKSQVEVAYQGLYSQAIVIQKGSSATTTPTTPTAPTTNPSSSTQEYVKPSPVEESHCADPVDLSTGSHVIDNELISLFGGQNLTLMASYNSSQLVKGQLGVGWSFNYEKSLSFSQNEILVYETPSVYSRYTLTDEANVYSCATKGRNNYKLTVSPNGAGYSLDCAGNKTEMYNVDGKLISVTNKQGFITTISYSNNLITLTDALTNKHIYLEKSSDGKITRAYDDNSREAVLIYSNDYLVSVEDVNGSYIHYTYNDSGRIETGTDNEGVCYFTNEYDASGRVAKQYDGSVVIGEDDIYSYYTVFSYGDNNTVTVTNRNGDNSTRTFDDYGQLTSYTDENGNTTTYSYDSNLNLISTTDALGNIETAAYNSQNLPISKTDKKGTVTLLSYDESGNITDIKYNPKGDVNEDGEIDVRDLVRLKKHIAGITIINNLSAADMNSDNEYNGMDLLLMRKCLLGIKNICNGSQEYTYNERNQIVSSTDLRGTTTDYIYDSNGMPLSKTVYGRTTAYVYLNGLLMSQTDARNNTTTYTYNSLGQMQTSTDAANNITTYTYDSKGNVLSVMNALGESVAYTYDSNGNKSSYTDANGNITFYSYTGNMKLEKVTTAEGVISYYYDGEDRLITTVDQNRKESSNEYDKAGRLVRKSDAEKNTTYYEYDAVGNALKTIDPNGGTTVNTYDALGNLLTTTDSLGHVTTYHYNAFSKPINITSALNGVTNYDYNIAGDILSVADALGDTTRFTYDCFGNKISSTDANGNKTSYSHDENNNLVSVMDALGNVTTNTYDCNNRLTEVTDANENKTTYGYDVLGRQTSVTDAKGNTITKTYDANGNVLTVTDAKGNVQSSAVYNLNNQATTIMNGAGSVTTNIYSATGNLILTTDALGNSQSYAYDNNGKMISAVNQDGKTSTVGFNNNGNVTTLTNSLGGAVSYTYDSANNLTSESTTSGGTVSYGYNALNLKESLTNARGQSTTFVYDAARRISGYTSPEGTASYTYDANGNVLTATDSKGTVTREYDSLNRVTKYTDVNGRVIQYSYDAVGNLSKLTYPDNTFVYYFYDACNNLIKVKWWSNYTPMPDIIGDFGTPDYSIGNELPLIATEDDDIDTSPLEISYTYDQNNNVLTVTKPDGSITTNTYDNAQRILSSVDRKSDNTIIVGYEYSYDELGRISSETHLAGNIRYDYTYDNLSRVTKRIVVNLADNTTSEESYTYDENGNVLTASTDGFIYDANNRLISYNGQAVTYDLDGNMLTADGMTYTYDSANRLISAGGNTYTYDVENIRVRNLCADSDTSYTYNTNGSLSQLLWAQTADGTIKKYVYGLGLIGEETNDSFKTYHYDYRGSTAAITDESGTVTDTFTYDTYGKLLNRTGTTDTPFLYNGRDGVMTDSNGLLYMRARYYNPTLKRFVNLDIIVGEITNSATLNRYAYANGNPVSNIDPFGLSAERGSTTVYYGDFWNGEDPEDMLYGNLSKKDLRKLDWINWTDFLWTNEQDYINSWKDLARLLSMGDMQDVVLDMINHFSDGTGTEYSNDILTETVKNHGATQAYMSDFTDVFKSMLQNNNGDVSTFANSDIFKNALSAAGVLFASNKYSYGGGLFDKDTYTGLTMAIHQWTESLVNLTSLKINGSSYTGTLQFTFMDNFGLDSGDLNQGFLAGFRSWYILQHYDKYDGNYQPFKTIVTIDYTFSGRF